MAGLGGGIEIQCGAACAFAGRCRVLSAARSFAGTEGAERRRKARSRGRGSRPGCFLVLTNPFAVIGTSRPTCARTLAQNAMVSGLMDAAIDAAIPGHAASDFYFVQQLGQWGLGWPLGIVAWGGLIWAVVVAARRRASPALVVMLAWALPYFALWALSTPNFCVTWRRQPPFLVVFGVGAAMAGYHWLAARWGQRGRVAWSVLAVVVAVATLGCTLVFTGVYRQEHPGSRRRGPDHANIPEGKKLLTEHWDYLCRRSRWTNSLGKPPSRSYQRSELPMWYLDTPEKLDALVGELSTADYIVLASNRLSAPIGRLRSRYPMSSQYYRMLFAGDLGYRPGGGKSMAYPQFGGRIIRDDNADEKLQRLRIIRVCGRCSKTSGG